MAQNGILKSSLAKKYAMAATGLFLCLFLAGHLAGNLQLFMAASDGGRQFNEYAKFMTTFPAVKVLSYLTYFSVLFHLVDGIVLSIQNRKARPVRYAMERASTNANWSSRNMMLLGTIVLVFLVTHMQNFWWQMHFGEVGPDSRRQVKDLYAVVAAFFNPELNSWALPAIGLYLLGQLPLGSTSGTDSPADSNPSACVTRATRRCCLAWARPSAWWCRCCSPPLSCSSTSPKPDGRNSKKR